MTFAREDEQATVKFSLSPGAAAKPGESIVTATMKAADSVSSDQGYQVIEYPHIHRQHYVEPAATRVKVIDVKIAPNLLVGYIMGVGDQVPQAIEQLGARVELIDADTLAFGDLSQYDVIMTGVRAYERRPDLRANNRRLIQYAENGGTVLVQYNKFEFNDAQYGPYPAKVSANRVTDEHAPVEVLVPDHPVFNGRTGLDRMRGTTGCRNAACISWASAIRVTSISSAPRIPSRSTRRRRPARWWRRASARAAGSISASGSGASCRPGRTAPTA